MQAIVTLETDIENAVGKHQNAVTSACKKSFKVRKLLKKLLRKGQYPGGQRN